MAMLCGCGDNRGSASAPDEVLSSKAIEFELLASRQFQSWLRAPGIIEPAASLSLSFRVPGTIAHFAVDEGDAVAPGDLIAELDRRDYLRELELAQANLTSAAAREARALRELKRQERLLSSNSTSTQSLETARSEHEVASAEARQANLRLEAAAVALEDVSLRAPVAGHIEQRLLDPHEFASISASVVVLTDLNTLKVRASVPDRAMSALKVGGAVEISSSAWPGRMFEGHIRRLAVSADPATHTLPIEIEVANSDLALLPAMVVEVRVPDRAAEDLITLPLSAVVRDSALRTICFVLVGSGDELRAESRPITLGSIWEDRVRILDGVGAGDRVVTRGQFFVRTGDRVHVAKLVPRPEGRTHREGAQ
jgi:RND family efflux transporter MFP subunit